MLGQPVTEWNALNLSALKSSMRINNAEVGTGHERHIIKGHSLEALILLANTETAQGNDLPADWIVMLGSIVKTKWVEKGDAVCVEIEGLGEASAHLI